MARGGLQFTLIIWLQGIWLPEHGYSFSETPLWAGIYGHPADHAGAADRRGRRPARLFSKPLRRAPVRDRRDAAIAATSFALLIVLPVGFAYALVSRSILFMRSGSGWGSLPRQAYCRRDEQPLRCLASGAGAGMLATFTSSSAVLSIGVFFSLMIVGLSSGLPSTLHNGLIAHGVSNADATRISHLPPVATLFASFLGYNPIKNLLGPHVLASLRPADSHALTGKSFFPHLISGPFHTALVYAFTFAIVACLVAAVASLMRGGKYHYEEKPAPAPARASVPEVVTS